MKTPRDCFERPIKEGDFFAYGARDGNSGSISAGKVLAIVEVKPEYGDPVTKLKTARVDVLWGGGRKYFKSTIEHTKQVIVVTDTSLPLEVVQRLNEFK